MIAALAVMMAGTGLGVYTPGGDGQYDYRPIATYPSYPLNMVDDVRRPGFNGRLYVTRPIMGGMEGPWAVAETDPGASYYGAYDNQDAHVYVRVGQAAIGINAWERIDHPGLRHLESARQFWLHENNYTDGVRTFVNDATLWGRHEARQDAGQASAPGPIEPRATFRVREDMPRGRSRIRVQNDSAAGTLAGLPGGGPVRVSWPQGASSDAVAGMDKLVAAANGAAPRAVASRGE